MVAQWSMDEQVGIAAAPKQQPRLHHGFQESSIPPDRALATTKANRQPSPTANAEYRPKPNLIDGPISPSGMAVSLRNPRGNQRDGEYLEIFHNRR
jgi:hypothetical protein